MAVSSMRENGKVERMINKNQKRLKIFSRTFIVMTGIMLFAFLFIFLVQSVNAEVTLKWYTNTADYTGLSSSYSSSTLPVTADVDGDGYHEIFYGGGTDAGSGEPHPGFVICLDGESGDVEWVDTCNGFGRHTVVELGDTDQDGRLELVACGMNRVACYDAETGDLEWDYWNDPDPENPTTNGRKDKHPLILKDTDGITYVYISGNGAASPSIKFNGATGEIVEYYPTAGHTCHGGMAGWDIDNDGNYDIFNTDRAGGNYKGLMWLDTDLDYVTYFNTVQCSSHCPTIVDANNDGYLDIVIADQSGGGICVIDGQTRGPMTEKWQEYIPGFSAHDNNNIYDIDGDGHLELISGDNNPDSGADIFDLEDWQLESYSSLWAAPGVGYAHPLAIGNVWQDNNSDEFELIGFTSSSDPSQGYLVIYQYENGDFVIRQTLNKYANQLIVQDVDNDGLNEIISIGTMAGIGSPTPRGVVQVYDTDGINSGYRTWNQWYSERRTGAPGDLGPSLAPLIIVDQIPPQITNIDFSTSNPLDEDPIYGWINITCDVFDDVVDEVYLNITNPDESYNNVSMNIGGSNNYYYNSTTAFSTYGNYSYFIWAKDTSDNQNTSSIIEFSMSPNWDVNNDGYCNYSDYLLISSRYGESGHPSWVREDVNNDGIISILDFILISNHYGGSWYTSDSYGQIKKWSIAWSSMVHEPQHQQYIADHFDLVSLSSYWPDEPATNIKTINPDIKILGYINAREMQEYYSDWSYVNQQEDWFVHDIYDNRIRTCTWNSYLMNPDPALGWFDYYGNKCAQRLNDHPQYDGIFGDGSYHLYGYPKWCVDGTPVPNEDFVPADIWDNFPGGCGSNYNCIEPGHWMYGHLQNAQNDIGDAIYMGNAGHDYLVAEDITNWHCYEGYVHGRTNPLDSDGWTEGVILHMMDEIRATAQKGVNICVISGTDMPENPTPEEMEKSHDIFVFALCNFLLVIDDLDKSWFAWQFYHDDESHGWWPEMDYEFGEPLGNCYEIEDSVFRRDFQNAIIVVNISNDDPHTVEIDNVIYELEPHTAEIII